MQTATDYDVSLIVPIYNVEQYLLDSLMSVAGQTMFERIQVILVDDGSTDASPAIAADFAAAHSNTVVITQANRGQGAARNRGIREAKAPFLAFLDSDDVLPPDSIEVRLKAMANDVDMVVGDMRTFPATTVWPWSEGVAAGDRTVDIVDFPALVTNGSPCNKLFRAAFFESNLFEVGRHFEDSFVVVPGLLTAARIRVIPDVVYNYRKRVSGGSTMDGLFTRIENYWDHLALAERIAELSADLPPARAAVARLYNIRSMQGFLLRAPEVMPENDLARYFAESRRVLSPLDPEEVVEGTHNLHHRIAFLALALDDSSLFVDRWTTTRGVTRRFGKTTLDVGHELTEEWASAMEVLAPRLLIEHVHIEGARALLSGRLELPGVPARTLEESMSVRITTRGRSVTKTSPVRVRRASSTAKPTTVLEWTCEFSAFNLKAGLHALDAHVLTSDGQFTIRARAAVGLQRSSRSRHTKGARLLLVPQAKDRVSILFQPRSRRLKRARWALRLVGDDLRGIRQQRPFAWVRVFRLCTRPLVAGRPIWLVGERPDTAQDNGYRLFVWLRNNAPDVRARYVLERGSSAWKSLKTRKGVLARGSWTHKVALLHATTLISSHDIDSYMLPKEWNPALYRRFVTYRLEQDRVFLQHGLTFKDVAAPLAREVLGVRLFVVSVAPEREYMAEQGRYTVELVETGMPRFDTLKRDPAGSVVLMPTWRKYLVLPSYTKGGVDPGTFEGSDYQRFYSEFLSSPRLLETLRRHRQTLTFMPHYEVAPYFHLEGLSSMIEIVSPDGNVQARINSASVLISDYSSVMFDAAYAGVPVIQVPFDLEEHSARHYAEGWFSNDGGEYWPVAHSVDAAIDELDEILSRGAKVAGPYQERLDELFPVRDRQNSRRVYEAIRSLN